MPDKEYVSADKVKRMNAKAVAVATSASALASKYEKQIKQERVRYQQVVESENQYRQQVVELTEEREILLSKIPKSCPNCGQSPLIGEE